MRRLLALSLTLGVVAGCGGDGAGTVPVAGVITFAGGPPPKPGSITFNPSNAAQGTTSRSGTARFAEDGTFTVTSYEEGDGLLPGKYTAVVECWQQPPVEPRDYERFNLVPQDYRPEVEVPSDQGEVAITLDVPAKK